MTTSKFREFQKDPCEDSEFEVKGGEECRTCTPNPDAFVPDWRQQEIGVPFKNKKTCQYCVVLIEDIEGKVVNADNITSHLENLGIDYENIPASEEQVVMRQLADSMGYRESALDIFLSEYSKLPPEANTEQSDILQESIGCEKAVLSTRQTISIGTPFKFLICVPCQEIDLLEDFEEDGDLMSFYTSSEVELDGRKLYAQLKRLSYTLSVFDRYTISEKDKFQIYESTDSLCQFTPGLYGAGGDQNVFKFYDDINKFLQKNDFSLGISKAVKLDHPDKIKIIFDNSNPVNPYTIKKIYAQKKYCDYVELKKNHSLLGSGVFLNTTVMGYISRLNDIDALLTSPKPPSWIDFLLDFTYPQLDISSGGEKVNALEDAPVQSFFADSLDQTVNLFTTFMSDVVTETFKEWSRKNCSSMVNGLGPEDDDDLMKILEVRGRKYLGADDSFFQIFNGEFWKNYGAEVAAGDNFANKTLRALGLCGTSALLNRAVRCLARGMDLNDFLRLQATINLKKLQPDVILLLANSLPFSVAQDITDSFIEEMGSAPLPWETDYPQSPPNGGKGARIFKKDEIKKFYEAGSQYEDFLEKLKASQEAAGGAVEANLKQLQSDLKKAQNEKRTAKQAEDDTETLLNDATNAYNDSLDTYNNDPTPENEKAMMDALDTMNLAQESKDGFHEDFNNAVEKESKARQSLEEYEKTLEGPDPQDLLSLIEDLGYPNTEEFIRDYEQLKALQSEATDISTGVNTKPPRWEVELRKTLEDVYSEEDLNNIVKNIKAAGGAVLGTIQYITDGVEDLTPDYLKDFIQERDLTSTERQFRREKRDAYDRKTRAERLAAVSQGTLYRPLPNLQAALTEAYVDKMLDHIGADDLQRIMDNIPDYVPIGPIADALKCPWNSLFYPPVKRFLGSTQLNTFFDCKEGDNVDLPFIDVMYVNFKDAFTKNIANAARQAITDAFLSLMMGLLETAIKLVDDTVCNALGGLGDYMQGAGEDGLMDVMADAFKDNPSDPKNPRRLSRGNMKDTMDKVVENLGISPDHCEDITAEQVSDSYADLYRAIGYALSVRELKELFSYSIDEYNPVSLTRVQQSVAIHAPCFKDFFNSSGAVGKFFRDVSSSVSLEKKQEIRESIDQQDALAPVFTSICLTKQQYGDWLRDRIKILTDLGIPEDVATENVLGEDRDNEEAAKSLLEALSDMDKFLKDNLADELSINDGPMFDEKGNLIDPSCKPSSPLLDFNSDDIDEAESKVTGAFFDSLEMIFVKDMTTGGAWREGLMDIIQANTNNQGFTKHSNRSNYKKKYHEGYESDDTDAKHKKADIFYPETIGLRYYEETSEDVEFNSTLVTPPGERNTDTGDGWRPTTADFLPTPEDPLEPEMVTPIDQGYLPSFSISYEQDWENFDTDRSKFLKKWESETSLHLNVRENSQLNFSIDKYKVTNLKNYSWNLTGTGPTIPPDPEMELEMKQSLDPYIESYLYENFDLSQSHDLPFRTSVFHKYLVDSFKHINVNLQLELDQEFYSSSYGKINAKIFNTVKNMCYNTPDGEMNDGFNFGYDPDSELTEENLNYVDPEPGSTEYTKKRKEKILGRAQEPNDRVHFLDPEKHGGSYIRPRIYVEPPRNLGWLGLRAAFIPEVDACEPARRVIINTKGIKDYVKDVKNKISRDPRLNNVSDCISLIPFDLIISQQTRAQMEGCIKAINRVYVTEAIIRTYPVFSSIFAGFDGNYDESFFELISTLIIEDLGGRKSLWSNKLISNKTYTNTFLEQCVQMYSRKYYSGEIEPTKEASQALRRLEQSQNRYKYPSDSWFKDFFKKRSIEYEYLHREPDLENMPYKTSADIPDEIVEQLWLLVAENPDALWDTSDMITKKDKIQEKLIERFYLHSLMYEDVGEQMFLPITGDGPKSVKIEKPPGDLALFVKKTNKYFRLYTRMYTIRTMRKECILLFKELLKEEFRYIMNTMVNAVDSKPDVFRVMQNFSTKPDVFYGNNTNYGTLDSVIETSVRGDIASVPNEVGSNIFNGMELSQEQIEDILESGCFVIQKYFKIIEKENPSVDEGVSSVIVNRPVGLYNVVNPESFLDFIKSPLPEDSEFSIDTDLLISDLFGDLEIIKGLESQTYVDGLIYDTESGELSTDFLPEGVSEEDLVPIGMTGTVGIKKGIRLMYVPNETLYNKIIENNPDLERIKQQLKEGDFSTTVVGLSEDHYAGITQSYLTEKAFITSPYISETGSEYEHLGLCIPITSVEIEEFDKELVNLEGFSDDDYKCLLDKLINTNEYKMLYDYCFPVRLYVGQNLVHTHSSFYLSIGQGEGERLEQDEFIGKDKPNTPRRGQPDDEIIDALDDTKDMLRNIFANIYTSEDFSKTFEFDFDKDFAGLKGWLSLIVPSFRIGGHKNVRRPFDKEGNECESPMGNIFGGK